MEHNSTSIIRRLFRAFPHLRISPLSFLLPLALTIFAVLCDGAALALIGPLLERVIQEAAQSTEAASSAVQAPVIRFIQRVLGLGPDASIAHLVTAVLLLSIIAIPLRKFSGLFIECTAKRLQHNLQPAFLSCELQYGKLYFQMQDHAAMHEGRLQATRYFANGLRLLHRCTEALAFIIFYLIILFSISAQLSIYFLLAGICMVCISTLFRKRFEALSREELARGKLLRRQMATCFQSIEVVKGNALEQTAYEKVCERAKSKLDAALQMSHWNFLSSIFQDVLSIVIVFVAVALYVYSAQELNTAIASNAAVFLVLARRILQPISVLNSSYLEAAKLHSGRTSFEELMRLDDKFIPYSGAKAVPSSLPDIRLSEVSYTYPNGYQALHDISCVLPAGQTVAIVGRSGAGKTTLMNLLLKAYDLPPQRIFLGDEDLREIDHHAWCSSLAYIPQNTTLFTGTLRENLSMSSAEELSEAQMQAALEKVLLGYLPEMLEGGFDGLLGERGNRLSRGEQQRISIARAMLQDPQLVLIDEATASLDVTTEAHLMEVLREFCRGRTAVFIAHRLATIRHADSIIVIEQGRIEEHGSFEQLRDAGGLFSHFWRLHSEHTDFRFS